MPKTLLSVGVDGVKCDSCGQEVALAKICPYCGHRILASEHERRSRRERPSGSFRGTVDERSEGGAHPASGGPFNQVIRFFLEPRISGWQKALVILALFYVVSPFDLLPGIALPVFGWFDDLAVATFAWRWISGTLSALDRKS